MVKGGIQTMPQDNAERLHHQHIPGDNATFTALQLNESHVQQCSADHVQKVKQLAKRTCTAQKSLRKK